MPDIDYNLNYKDGNIAIYDNGSREYALNLVLNWLSWEEGTLWHNPAFGNNLRSMLGEPLTPLTKGLLEDQLISKINIDIPFVTLDGIEIVETDIDRIVVSIRVAGITTDFNFTA